MIRSMKNNKIKSSLSQLKTFVKHSVTRYKGLNLKQRTLLITGSSVVFIMLITVGFFIENAFLSNNSQVANGVASGSFEEGNKSKNENEEEPDNTSDTPPTTQSTELGLIDNQLIQKTYPGFTISVFPSDEMYVAVKYTVTVPNGMDTGNGIVVYRDKEANMPFRWTKHNTPYSTQSPVLTRHAPGSFAGAINGGKSSSGNVPSWDGYYKACVLDENNDFSWYDERKEIYDLGCKNIYTNEFYFSDVRSNFPKFYNNHQDGFLKGDSEKYYKSSDVTNQSYVVENLEDISNEEKYELIPNSEKPTYYETQGGNYAKFN